MQWFTSSSSTLQGLTSRPTSSDHQLFHQPHSLILNFRASPVLPPAYNLLLTNSSLALPPASQPPSDQQLVNSSSISLTASSWLTDLRQLFHQIFYQIKPPAFSPASLSASLPEVLKPSLIQQLYFGRTCNILYSWLAVFHQRCGARAKFTVWFEIKEISGGSGNEDRGADQKMAQQHCPLPASQLDWPR